MSKENQRGESSKISGEKEIDGDHALDKKVVIAEEGEKGLEQERERGLGPGEKKRKKEEEDDEEDSIETLMFEKLCSLEFQKPGSGNNWHSMGTETIKIVYDRHMLCCRVNFADQNDKWLFGNVIRKNLELKVN